MPLRRSDVNRSVCVARRVFGHFGLHLPAWAHWTPDRWRAVADDPAFDEIRDCMLGWDVTDFGSGDFARIGRTLLTLRNGRVGDERYPKSYAEKLLLNPEGQRAPAHFHRSKREDIVCVAGGNMLVRFESADNAGGAMTVRVDGVSRDVPPGGLVRLEPGQSVTIPPRTVHRFWGEEGAGLDVDGVGHTISREVSSVCDDRNDNVFTADAGERFPPIDEDEPRRVCLCHEYPRRR